MLAATPRPYEASGPGDDALGPTLDSLLKIKQRIARSLGEEGERLVVQALIDQIPDFIFVKDLRSRFVIANISIAQAYRASPEGLVGLTDFDLHPAERAEAFYAYEQQVMRSGLPLFNMEESFPDGEGIPRWYSTTKVPLRNRDGTVCGLIGIARDITQRKLTQSFELRQANILAMIATNAELGEVLGEIVALIESQLIKVKASILLVDADGRCLRRGAAPSLPDAYRQAIDGIPIGPCAGSCGTAAHRRKPVVVTDTWSDPLWEKLRHLAVKYDLRSCWSTPITAHDGRVLGTFALYWDIVRSPGQDELRLTQTAIRIAGIAIERHQSQLQLVRMAHYDALTDLPNRVLFLERLNGALKQRHSQACQIALLYIDLDGFKEVNDHLGHLSGDRLLVEVGARLRSFVSEHVTISRLGGDEFAAIQSLGKPADRADTARLASALIAALSAPYRLAGHDIVAGASIGVAIAPDDDDAPDALLRDADLALYQAKSNERGGVRFFEPAMNIRAQLRHQLETDLRRAVEENAFNLYFQPQVRLNSGSICGFEALLRWPHPERGIVGPQEFIPMAEELGLIVPLGQWVLHQACMQAVLWPSNIKIAVNLSPVQFRDGSLFETVSSALSHSGLAPERLELEITESVILLDNEANLAVLHRIRSLGVQIALDDFGVGYSSLSYLRSFPFTKIKIDRSFVQDLENSPGCLAIVRAVTRLASDLGMETTAEGIETVDQWERLRRKGCQSGQGFLFSPPVPYAEASRLLDRSALGLTPMLKNDDRRQHDPSLRPA